MLKDEPFKAIPLLRKLHSEERDKDFSRFLKEACNDKNIHQIAVTFPVLNEGFSPLHWFDNHSTKFAFNFYWEHPSTAAAFAALGSTRNISAKGVNRFELLENALQLENSKTAQFDFTKNTASELPRWVGGFSFFNELNSSIWRGFQPASLTLPELSLVKKVGHSIACITLSLNEQSKPEELQNEIARRMKNFIPKNIKNGNFGTSKKSETGAIDENAAHTARKEWINLINRAKGEIAVRKFEKVVLARQHQLTMQKPTDAAKILSRLRKKHPECCCFLIKREHSGTFLGCSPELLFSIRNDAIETEALAGSIGRSSDEQKDTALAGRLFDSLKEQKEHAYVVHSIREELSPLVNNLSNPNLPEIKKLAEIQHLYTPIRGQLNKSVSPLEIVEKLHPTPALGGFPRSAALQFIRDYEPFERGWFAAPIGWITPNGEADFYVAIRCGLMNEEETVLFAGCGIVAVSDPRAEWEEVNLKFKPMLSALNDG
jgi:menaquinone-specific isochorismate synthase